MELEFRNLTASEVEARIGRGDASNAAILLYKDARCDQRILDETVGAMNWQKRYTNGNANCIISIWDKDKSQWVEKEDVGQCNGPDARKGTASDACKRASVCWGIGRELYTAPKLLVPLSVLTNYRMEKDGTFCDNTFRVKELKSSSNKIITDLEIDVLLDEVVVYTVSFHSADATAGPAVPDKTATTTTSASITSLSQTPPDATQTNSEITEADVAVMYAKAELAGSSQAGVLEWINKQYKLTNVYELTATQYQTVCRKLDEQAQKKKIA